jgi:hypothetical protein
VWSDCAWLIVSQSCCSDCAARYIDSGTLMEMLRSFGVYAQEAQGNPSPQLNNTSLIPCLNLGPTFVCQLLQAFPCIYGSKHHEFCPQLPPKHPAIAQERIFLDEYLEYLYCECLSRPQACIGSLFLECQGLSTKLKWEDVFRDVEECAGKIIDPQCLPPNPPCFVHPLKWSDDEVISFAQHICEHQARLDSGDDSTEATAFQWLEPDSDGEFHKKISPCSKLAYAEESSFYYLAMRKYQFLATHYMAPAPRPFFNQTAQKAVLQSSLDMPVAQEVMKLLNRCSKHAYITVSKMLVIGKTIDIGCTVCSSR